MTKRKYINPQVEEIRLDNEISLQLASTPTAPTDPNFNLSTGEEEGYTYENW
ncbi:MAG TPA: hypothetical protein GXZ87_06745 [Bacteroidales bacterium]|nr:hypothetical protein [Bacteroidales bacterium]